MSRSKWSPLSIKVEQHFEPKNTRSIEIEQQIAELQHCLNNMSFDTIDIQKLKQCQSMLLPLRQNDQRIKCMNDELAELNKLLPTVPKQKPKSYNAQLSTSQRAITYILNECEYSKHQINILRNKQIQIQHASDQMKQIEAIGHSKDLSHRISECERELYESINQARRQIYNHSMNYDEIIERGLKETPAYEKYKLQSQKVSNLIGMLWCIRKSNDDQMVKKNVKYFYEQSQPPQVRLKTKKDSEQLQLQVEKREKLKFISKQMDRNDQAILRKGNYLEEKVRDLKQTEQLLLPKRKEEFNYAFKELETLTAKIEGTISYYKMELESIEESLIFSKCKNFKGLHHDQNLRKVHQKMEEFTEKWRELNKFLKFQFCDSS